jgi:hypothetical protein
MKTKKQSLVEYFDKQSLKYPGLFWSLLGRNSTTSKLKLAMELSFLDIEIYPVKHKTQICPYFIFRRVYNILSNLKESQLALLRFEKLYGSTKTRHKLDAYTVTLSLSGAFKQQQLANLTNILFRFRLFKQLGLLKEYKSTKPSAGRKSSGGQSPLLDSLMIRFHSPATTNNSRRQHQPADQHFPSYLQWKSPNPRGVTIDPSTYNSYYNHFNTIFNNTAANMRTT